MYKIIPDLLSSLTFFPSNQQDTVSGKISVCLYHNFMCSLSRAPNSNMHPITNQERVFASCRITLKIQPHE